MMARTIVDTNSWPAKLRRVRALVRKETLQVLRDPSSIAMGVILPLILILLFGYGLSLDVKNVPLAVVIDETSDEAVGLLASFQLSPYFKPRISRSMVLAQQLLLEQKVDGIVRIPSDFVRQLGAGHADLQLIVHGGDANRARIIQGYVQGAAGAWSAQRAAQGKSANNAQVILQTRMWFNEADNSSYFLVPGLIVLVMTLIGALLTAMVMARE